MKAVLIDHGAGNVVSVEKALRHAGLALERAKTPEGLTTPDVLVLPGQGHFGQVMEAFKNSGFEPLVREHLAADRPFLGICVGLQILLDGSEEAPGVPGLGVFPGTVRRFQSTHDSIPHMGWNEVKHDGRSALLAGLPSPFHAYFAHSYYVPTSDVLKTAATTTYAGAEFASILEKGRLTATQFHPEKSQEAGLRLLKNFVNQAVAHRPQPELT